MSFTFICLDPNDVEVSMCVPERSIDEMCEYFQRFLSACGYLFENNERIRCVADKIQESRYPTSVTDILELGEPRAAMDFRVGGSQNNDIISFG